jgi:hypothetical protein
MGWRKTSGDESGRRIMQGEDEADAKNVDGNNKIVLFMCVNYDGYQ